MQNALQRYNKKLTYASVCIKYTKKKTPKGPFKTNSLIYLDVGIDVLGTPEGVVEDEGDADDGDDIAD